VPDANTGPAPAADLEAAVRRWLAEHGFVEDYRDEHGYALYTRERWLARGEDYGADATVTIISEGELYGLWAKDPSYDKEPLRSLRDRAYELGHFPYRGFGWSMHFAPIPD
jgi:hypothetical protein